jgi:hypothetical protein
MGISLVTVPEAARVLRHSPRHLRLFCVLVAAVLAVAAAAWGVAAHLVLPLGIGHVALRSLWRPTNQLILPVTLAVMGTCATVGASAGLRALGSSKRSLRAMIISSTVAVVASVLGTLAGGAVGTVRGMAVAGGIATVVWWWQLHAALRESRISKQAALLRPDKSAGRHRAADAARSRPAPDHQPAPGQRPAPDHQLPPDRQPAPGQRQPRQPDHSQRPAPLWTSEWRQ